MSATTLAGHLAEKLIPIMPLRQAEALAALGHTFKLASLERAFAKMVAKHIDPSGDIDAKSLEEDPIVLSLRDISARLIEDPSSIHHHEIYNLLKNT